MTRKIYVLRDRKNSASFILTGKTGNRVRYNFTGGSVMQNIPATFVSENEYCQELLEQSALFKKGIIGIRQVIKSEEPEEKKPVVTDLEKVYGVNSASQAMSYIAEKFGEKVVSGREAVAYGLSHGFCFPELKLK